MTAEQLLQLLTDPENQPHQYVGHPEQLARLLDKIINNKAA